MYISRSGLAAARDRLAALRERLKATSEEAADVYNSAGNQWHDNPQWDDATRRVNILAQEIEILRHEIEIAQPIETPADDYNVAIGHRVDFFDAKGKASHLVILGPLEADSQNYIISYEAPIAQALIGKSLGADVEFGDELMTITRISPWEGL